MQAMSESACQTWIDCHEFIHLVFIASHDHHKFATVVFHTLHQGIYSFLAVSVVAVTQRIGLIHKEDTAHGLIAHVVHYLRRLTHILTHQCSTTSFHHMRCRQDFQTLQHFAHLAGYRGLSCTWVTGEHKVHRHLLYFAYACFRTLLHKHRLHGEASDHILHRAHAHKVIEFIEHFIQRTYTLRPLLTQVFCGDAVHILLVEVGLAYQIHQSLALSLHCLSKHAAGLTGIAEVLVSAEIQLFKLPMDSTLCIIIHHEFLGLAQVHEYLSKFIRCIVLEVYGLRETALQSGVAVYEVMHLVSISGHDADKLASVIFQSFQ